MSLLTICQDAAAEVGVAKPTAIAAGLDVTSRKLFRMANKVGKRLMKFNAWQVLRTELSFTATAGAQQDVIPTDFDRFVPETFWNRTDDYLLAGPIGAVEWNGLQALGETGDSRKFIYRANGIYFYPAAAGGDTYAFEYVSKNFADIEATGTPKAAFTLDTDVPRLDAELMTLGIVYEYLKGDGLDSGTAWADYTAMAKQLVKNDQPAANIMVAADIFGQSTRHFVGEPTNVNTSSLL